jgi:hypothetical protein
MRILLVSDVPFHGSPQGDLAYALALDWQQLGHEVRAVVVDDTWQSHEAFPVRRIVCRRDDPRADVRFDFPCFTDHRLSHQTYAALTDAQVAAYREALRRALDDEIEELAPDLVHVSHLWLHAHLVLEAGVPYVVSSFGQELGVLAVDSRYWRFASESAENAGRVVACDEYVHGQLSAAFGGLEGRLVTVEPSTVMPNGGSRLIELFRQTLEERYGRAL